MKKLLLLTFIVFFTSNINAQHFPPVGAVWKMDYFHDNAHWNPYRKPDTWSVVKDTMIQNRPCRKVAHSNMVDLPPDEDNTFFFCESNDSLYQYTLWDSVFHFYFWYGAKPGDTLVVEDAHFDGMSHIKSTVVVKYIRTAIASNDSAFTYKVYELKTLGPAGKQRYIADRIFLDKYTNFFPDAGMTLYSQGWPLNLVRCYSDSTHPEIRPFSYANGYPCDYFLQTSLNKNESTSLALIYNPNPTSGIISLNLPTGFKHGQIEIFDLSGKRIYRNDLLKENPSLDLSALKNGMYLMLLTTESSQLQSKIILQK